MSNGKVKTSGTAQGHTTWVVGLMADIRDTYDARLHQRFRTEQYASYMVSVFEEMSYPSARYFTASNNCTRKNCVLGSGLNVSKSKLMKPKVVFILRELAV